MLVGLLQSHTILSKLPWQAAFLAWRMLCQYSCASWLCVLFVSVPVPGYLLFLHPYLPSAKRVISIHGRRWVCTFKPSFRFEFVWFGPVVRVHMSMINVTVNNGLSIHTKGYQSDEQKRDGMKGLTYAFGYEQPTGKHCILLCYSLYATSSHGIHAQSFLNNCVQIRQVLQLLVTKQFLSRL